MRLFFCLALVCIVSDLFAQSTMFYQTYNSVTGKAQVLAGPYISDNGNIGINKAPGAFGLDINGTLRVNDKIHPGDGNIEKYIDLNNSNFAYSTFTDHTWRVWRNSLGNYNNIARFGGGGFSREPYFSFNTTTAADDTTTVTIKANSNDGSTFPLKILDSDGNVIYAIDSNGNITPNPEKKGTTPTATSGTTLLITHNLGSFPTAINITPAGDIGNWHLSGINTTTMTLNYETVTPSSVTIYWQVE